MVLRWQTPQQGRSLVTLVAVLLLLLLQLTAGDVKKQTESTNTVAEEDLDEEQQELEDLDYGKMQLNNTRRFCHLPHVRTSPGDLPSYALTDTEAKFSMADGFAFFEIVEPEELAYTYKINPADFALPWVIRFCSFLLMS